MYKLLIVDDEDLERQALRTMLVRMFQEIEVVGEARNGREAIELADRYHPDIITMDIKMPGLNGLETIEEIKLNHPATSFVILSAFDSFQYAQKAMKLNVNHYLLKPYNRNELKETIHEVFNQKQKEKINRIEKLKIKNRVGHVSSLAETEWVSTLIHNQTQDLSLDDLNQLMDIEFDSGMALVLSVKKERSFKEEEKQTLYRSIKNTMKKQGHCLVGSMINDYIPTFVLAEPEKTVSLRNYAVLLVKNVLSTLANVREWKDVQIFAGAGSVSYSLEELKKSYNEALVASRDKEYKGAVRFYGDLQLNPEHQSLPYEKEKWLLQALQIGDTIHAEKILEDIFSDVVMAYYSRVDRLKRYLTELFAFITRGTEVYHSANFMLDDATTVEQVKERFFSDFKMVLKKLDYSSMDNNDGILKRAKSFIYQHYADDLSLEDVAEKINLSPAYFSKLFKEQTGVNFIDYVTEIRVEKAKELIITSSLSLKEICYEVGYRDPNYFSRVFKKYETLTPTQFRKEKSKG